MDLKLRPISQFEASDSSKLSRQLSQFEDDMHGTLIGMANVFVEKYLVTPPMQQSFVAQVGMLVVVDSSKGNVQVKLPAPSPQNAGRMVAVMRTSASNTVKVTPTTGTVRGGASYSLGATAGLCVYFISTGAAWGAN